VRTESIQHHRHERKGCRGAVPGSGANATGPYPEECASFEQLGFRVPLMAVSHSRSRAMSRIRWGITLRCWRSSRSGS